MGNNVIISNKGKSLTLSVGMYIVLIPMCNPSVWSIGSDDGNVITDNASPTVREKRAVLIAISSKLRQIGTQALNKLRTNSRFLGETKTSRLYKKTGNYEKAIKDFQSVRPENVRLRNDAFQVGREGIVGDRIVKLRKEGYYKRPTIYVIKPPESPGQLAEIDMIYYKTSPVKQKSADVVDID